MEKRYTIYIVRQPKEPVDPTYYDRLERKPRLSRLETWMRNGMFLASFILVILLALLAGRFLSYVLMGGQ